MKVLKDTFQQGFKLHIYWWELKKEKSPQTHTYFHVHINAHTHKRIRTCKHTRTHMDNYIIIYTQTYPCTHRLTTETDLYIKINYN